jgi:hypothetical protein
MDDLVKTVAMELLCEDLHGGFIHRDASLGRDDAE